MKQQAKLLYQLRTFLPRRSRRLRPAPYQSPSRLTGTAGGKNIGRLVICGLYLISSVVTHISLSVLSPESSFSASSIFEPLLQNVTSAQEIEHDASYLLPEPIRMYYTNGKLEFS